MSDAPEIILPDSEVPTALAERFAPPVISIDEINQQVATAKRYPRSLTAFQRDSMSMATMNQAQAERCVYALKRSNKVIEGPSARFAEIVLSSWGNSRGGARVIAIEGKHIVAQGAFHDLERNVQITMEVRRRITDREGMRYSEDMVVTTGNAACSIAFRNAVLKGIPQSFWYPVYEQTRKVIAGDSKDLGARVKATLEEIEKKHGIKADKVFTTLGVKGATDIDVDRLVTLRGILTAIEEGDTTANQAFGHHPHAAPAPEPVSKQPINKQQLALLEKHMKDHGFTNTMKACAKYNIKALAELPFNQLNDAMEYIEYAARFGDA